MLYIAQERERYIIMSAFKNLLSPIQVQLCIEVEVYYFSKSRSYMLYDRENKREVGLIIDVNRDGNFRFFTSFYQGDTLDASIVLKNKDNVIQSLKNGKKKTRLELQIHENVILSGPRHLRIPKKDNKNPDLILGGELKEPYYIFKDPKSEKWIVYCFDYWGELLDPKNPYDFWCYG